MRQNDRQRSIEQLEQSAHNLISKISDISYALTDMRREADYIMKEIEQLRSEEASAPPYRHAAAWQPEQLQSRTLGSGNVIKNSRAMVPCSGTGSYEAKPALASQPAAPAAAATYGSSSLVTAYNGLPSTGSFNDRGPRNEFIMKFHIVGFDCANTEERMSYPSTPPRYRDSEPVPAMYWAAPLRDQQYAVMPNAKLTYEVSLHAPGAMEEAFSSNFLAGHVYRHIQLISPAVFMKLNGTWSLRKKGELRLQE